MRTSGDLRSSGPGPKFTDKEAETQRRLCSGSCPVNEEADEVENFGLHASCKGVFIKFEGI